LLHIGLRYVVIVQRTPLRRLLQTGHRPVKASAAINA